MKSLRRFGCFAACCLILAFLMPEASAQTRIYARVEPNVDANPDKLIFDINVSPDDNVAPNILFTPDSKRGFVAYPGSGTIAFFSVDTGEILSRVKTGGKPFFGTRLPDNRTVLYTSVWDTDQGVIYVVDSQVPELVATYRFPKASFGFGSIVELSPDGATGYVSSTGTGELIKFNIADGTEIRRLGGMVAPGPVTVSRDGSTVMVVDVDSSREEVVFVDSAAMSRKSATLKGPTDRIMNFTIFNKPVLSPDGTRGIIASRDLNGTLGSDTVVYFDAVSGARLDTKTIGSEPGFTTLTPDGQYWAILCEFTINLISTTDFAQQRDLQLVEGESIGSTNIVFTPDMKYAYYASSAQDLVFQYDIVNTAVVGQVRIGDNPNEFIDQPSTIARTPDGRALAVVDFVSNNVELLTQATALGAAKYISSADQFTGLTILNIGPSINKFVVYALNNFGELVTEEGVENPVTFLLEPNQQVTKTVAEIFKFDNSKERAGWISVYSDFPEATGYVSFGDTAMTRLDAAPLFRERLFEWIIPEVVRQEGKSVELNWVNPNFNQGTYDLVRVGRDGAQIETKTGNTAYPTNRQPQFFADQFPEPAEVKDGYLRATSGIGLLFTEIYGDANATAALNAIDLSRYTGVNRIYSPHFATIPGFTTILNVINAAAEDAEITITLHAPGGEVIGTPLKKTFVKGEQLKGDLAVLFENQPAVSGVTGWLEIASTRDRVVGTVTFTNAEGRFLTAFELSPAPRADFLFPVVAEDAVYQTGVALLNANAAPARVTVELWGENGTLDRSVAVDLGAGQQTAAYLASFFPGLGTRVTGHVRVHSTQPLHGFSLINDRSLTFITAIPSLPLQ